jgi:hypothetical protein
MKYEYLFLFIDKLINLYSGSRLRSEERHSRRSPGWQSRISQIAAKVEKRRARALPVFKMERFLSLKWMASASSLEVIFFLAKRMWSLMMIGMNP